MKRVVIAAALVLVSLPAAAISRYNTDKMSCAQAHTILAREGAAIFRYKSKRQPRLTLYDRFVSGPRFCQFAGQYADPAWFATRDRQACPAYVCRQQDYDDFPFDSDLFR